MKMHNEVSVLVVTDEDFNDSSESVSALSRLKLDVFDRVKHVDFVIHIPSEGEAQGIVLKRRL